MELFGSGLIPDIYHIQDLILPPEQLESTTESLWAIKMYYAEAPAALPLTTEDIPTETSSIHTKDGLLVD